MRTDAIAFLNWLATGALVAGTLAIAATLVPFETIKAYAEGFATSGQGNTLIVEAHGRALIILRGVGIALLSAAALIRLVRPRFTAQLSRFGAALHEDIHTLRLEANRAAHVLWRDRTVDLVVLVILVIVGVFVRYQFLLQPLRFDEALTYGTFAARPLFVTMSHYAEPNNHIFHSVLVHLSCDLFGNSLWAVRLPALMAGLLAIPASYWAFSLIYNRGVALLTSAIVGALPPLVEFSTYARGYSIVTLFFILLLGIAAMLMRRKSVLLWLAFAIIAALGFYTVPTMLYPFGIVLTWMGLSVIVDKQNQGIRASHLAKGVILTGVLVGALYLPVAIVSGPAAVMGNRWVASASLSDFARNLPILARSIARHWHGDVPEAARYLLIGGMILGLWWGHARLSKYRVPLLAAVIAWLSVALTVQRVIPFVRTWIFLVPIYACTVAAGVVVLAEWIERRTGRSVQTWFVPVAACVISLWLGVGLLEHRSVFVPDGGTFAEAPKIMAALKGSTDSAETVIVSAPTYIFFRAYARLHGFPFESYTTSSDIAPHGLVIVNEQWNETPADNLLPASLWRRDSTPSLIMRVGSAAVYRW